MVQIEPDPLTVTEPTEPVPHPQADPAATTGGFPLGDAQGAGAGVADAELPTRVRLCLDHPGRGNLPCREQNRGKSGDTIILPRL